MRLPEPAGGIALENLTCLTGDRERTAIESINLSIEPGLFVGVLGLSGAGKSTLLAAIVGAAPTDKGCVRIDGASLNEWDSAQLARQIGYLPQDFALFSGSVRDNISRFERFLGDERPEAIDARTVAAAQAAGVHETILSLPNGYQTQLGLGGTGLSAGQTQRIALARALYGDPRIIVLDEPNAHLDSEAELKLIETLAQLKRRGATVLVAAHRGAILANADKLLLLSGGRVEIYGGLADVATEMRSRVEAVAAADQKETRRA
jgi:ATP-binding cassette subfamily C protein